MWVAAFYFIPISGYKQLSLSLFKTTIFNLLKYLKMSRTPIKEQMVISKLAIKETTTTSVVRPKHLLTQRKQKQPNKSPLLLLLLLRKRAKKVLEHSFFKLSIYKNHHHARKIITRYFASIIKFKLKSNEEKAWGKLKANRHRHRALVNFVKMLPLVTTNLKRTGFFQMKFAPRVELTSDVKPMTIKDSRVSVSSRRGANLNRSVEATPISSVGKQSVARKIEFDDVDGDTIEKLKRQNEEFKCMQMSEAARQALKKVQRFDRIIYARQTEKICREVIKEQIKRLQKIKNSNKDMRVKYYDNELSLIALFNHIKLIHEMDGDLGQLQSVKEQIQKEQIRKKEEQFKRNLENKKKATKSTHSANVQNEIHAMMGKIDGFLSEKQFQKAQINIQAFLKKYEKEEFAKDRVHLYQALRHTIADYRQIQGCMNDVSKFMETLSIADLSDVDARIRTFTGNHKEFKYLFTKYNKNEKPHGKQMINILHSMEGFNNDIIKYLEQKKQLKKISTQKEPTDNKEKFEAEVKKLEKQLKDEKKRIAELSVELEKNKAKIVELQKDHATIEAEKKTQKDFIKKVTAITEKANRGADWIKDLQLLRKDQNFVNEKIYMQFLTFGEGIRHANEKKLHKQSQSLCDVFISLAKVFQKQKMTHQKRFNQTSKILQLALKKDPNLAEVNKHLESLMVTIVERSKEDSEEQRIRHIQQEKQVVETKLVVERQRVRKLSTEIEQMKMPGSAKSAGKYGALRTPARSRDRNMTEETPSNNKFVELQSNYKDLQRHFQTQKKEKEKIEKEVESFEQKMAAILSKLQKSADGAKQFDLIKKDKKQVDNKYIQMFLKLYSFIAPKQASQPKEAQKTEALSRQNKKLNETVESQRQKNKSLNEKMKSLQKTSKEQTQKLATLQKQNQTLKEKQQKFRQLSVKKTVASGKSEEVVKLQTQLKKLQQEIKQREADVLKQEKKIEKEAALRTNIESSLQKVAELLEKKQFNQFQIQINKIIRTIDKNADFSVLIHSLQILLSLSPKDDAKRLIQLEKQLATQSTKAHKYEQLSQIIKQMNEKLTKKPFTNDPNIVNKIVTPQICQKLPEAKYLLEIVNTLSQTDKTKNEKLDKLNEKNKETSIIIESMTTNIRRIQTMISTKEYISGEFMTEEDYPNEFVASFYRILRKVHEKYLQKLTDDRKLNEKSIKSYEGQLQKINNLIGQYDKKLEQKDEEYAELYKTFIDLQKSQQPPEQNRRSQSLRSSRKSFRSSKSNNEQKEDTSALKASLQAHAQEEKSMLLKIDELQNQKFLIEDKMRSMEREIASSDRHCEELQNRIKILQKNLEEEHEAYQRQFSEWKKKTKRYDEQINQLKLKYEKQFQQKEQKLLTQINQISREREIALESYHKDLVTVQEELSQQILHLRQQLEIATNDQSQIQELRSANSILEQNILILQDRVVSFGRQESQEKEAQIQRIKSEQQARITREVTEALVRQETDFNAFLDKHDKQREDHYEKVIIPSRIEQFKLSLNSTTQQSEATKLKLESLSRYTIDLQTQLEEKQTQLRNLIDEYSKLQMGMQRVQHLLQEQILMTQRIQSKYTSEITFWESKVNETIKIYESKIENYNIVSQEKASLVENGDRAKLQRLEALIMDLEAKYQQESRLNARLSTQLQTSQDKEAYWERQLRSIESKWEERVYQLNMSHSKEILELRKAEQTPPQRIEPQAQEIRQQRAPPDNFWEQKYQDSVATYEMRIRELNERILADSRSLLEANLAHQRLQQLTRRYDDLGRRLKQNEGRYHQEIQQVNRNWEIKIQQKIDYYERRVSEYNNQITNMQQTYHSSLTSFNHKECEDRYRILQEKSNAEIHELRSRVNSASQAQRQEVSMLKQVISNQKLELRQLEIMVNSVKEAKEEAQREKQSYYHELKNTSLQKDREILRIKSQYDTAITNLQSKLQLTSSQQSLHVTSSYRSTEDESNRIRLVELESQVSNKNMEIRQCEEMLDRKRRQLDDERGRFRNLQRERDSLLQKNGHLQTHVIKLEADISLLNNENSHYRSQLMALREKEELLRDNLVRIKTESEHESYLKEEVTNLRQQVHQFKNLSALENSRYKNQAFEKQQKVNSLIKDISNQRSYQGYGYDETEIQILKKINEEVTELVDANRHLQTKCALLEAQSQLSERSIDVVNFFMYLQDKMNALVNFLLDKNLIDSADSYSRFSIQSRDSLERLKFEDYFGHWLNFMKSLFLSADELHSTELRLKAEEMMELKEQMNEVLEKHIEYSEDENYQTLEKYKMIFTDIKFLLREYLKGGDAEYLHMINRSLGVDE